MTPEAFLDQIDRLVEAGSFSELVAFSDEHLTEDMLDVMTPQQRRDVHSALHIAVRFVGEGPLDPPRGIPVDDEDDDPTDAAADDSSVPARAR